MNEFTGYTSQDINTMWTTFIFFVVILFILTIPHLICRAIDWYYFTILCLVPSIKFRIKACYGKIVNSLSTRRVLRRLNKYRRDK